MPVGSAVAEVVDKEQGIDNQTTGDRKDEDRERDSVHLNIIGDAHGDDAKEHQYQYVAPTMIGEVGGVEETEDHTQ